MMLPVSDGNIDIQQFPAAMDAKKAAQVVLQCRMYLASVFGPEHETVPIARFLAIAWAVAGGELLRSIAAQISLQLGELFEAILEENWAEAARGGDAGIVRRSDWSSNTDREREKALIAYMTSSSARLQGELVDSIAGDASSIGKKRRLLMAVVSPDNLLSWAAPREP